MTALARPIGAAATAAGAGLLGVGAWVLHAWVRYSHVDPRRHPPDELLDRFLPEPVVDEYHRVHVRAPAAVTLAAARDTDLFGSPLVRAVFWLRAIPAMLRGTPFRPGGSRGLLGETLALGWTVLAEVPDREVVVGACTQPWHQNVTFHGLSPERFAPFDEPGYVKIVWTITAEPLGSDESLFVTRTRVAVSDAEARTRFRRYWAPMSVGIVLIRYLCLALVKREAERRVRRPARVDGDLAALQEPV